MLLQKNIRVVQLIDSLEPGGAERMAVTIANDLVNKIQFSGLVVTRSEGDLKKSIGENVFYAFLNKKKAIDLNALLRCKRFLKENKVSHIHAHGSSYFFGVLMKLIFPSVSLVWHDHHGNRIHSKKANVFIKISSLFFSGILTVNLELEHWAKQNLYCKKVIFFPNFVSSKGSEDVKTTLNGEEGKRIVCLANLRNPKNHFSLLTAFHQSEAIKQDWTLHLVGKDNHDEYSMLLKDFIKLNHLENKVFLYGSRTDTHHILKQANVGILVSTFEGFPVTLLEYGMAKLAVISTNVGYCSSLIEDEITGLIVNPKDINEIFNKINRITADLHFREYLSLNFNTFVKHNYSSEVITDLLIDFYTKLN
ncbi:glycosyl transferase, group 1 family protein [Flavobacteria bacterium BAL38]|nr:glycosyl transferase, group 1 family protein [Flavobacteria bacterium BAL38]